MKIIEDTSSKYLLRLLVVLFPALIVPMISYDFLIFYFKHYTVVYSSMIVGLMIGIIILIVIEKISKLIKGNYSKISDKKTTKYRID